MGICRIDGCSNSSIAKQLCTKHYQRFKSHGDPEYCKNPRELHGLRYTDEYRTWLLMKDRCNNENNKNYDIYGGRGIKVCEKWSKSFKAFYNDMGKRPKYNYQLDRIDTNKGYFKDNCRWVTSATNNQNRRNNKLNWDKVNNIRYLYSKGGKTKADLARAYNISHSMVTSIVKNEKWRV